MKDRTTIGDTSLPIPPDEFERQLKSSWPHRHIRIEEGINKDGVREMAVMLSVGCQHDYAWVIGKGKWEYEWCPKCGALAKRVQRTKTCYVVEGFIMPVGENGDDPFFDKKNQTGSKWDAEYRMNYVNSRLLQEAWQCEPPPDIDSFPGYLWEKKPKPIDDK